MAEVQQRVQMDLVKQQQREVKFRQELERRQFQGRFNELIKAINSFAKQYNDGNGMVWPQGEAAKLEKAMRSVEKSLGAHPGMTNDRKGISR
jgi:prolyl-tRNA synthetase